MTAPVFVDTNVFVYAVDAGNPEKHRSAREWEGWLWRSRLGRTSFQVLQEFFVAVTRKQPEARDAARKEIRSLLIWQPLPIEPAVLELGWKLQDRYQLSFWDSMIVAAAKALDCGYLLTEDLQAGQKLDGILVVNPFQQKPNSLN